MELTRMWVCSSPERHSSTARTVMSVSEAKNRGLSTTTRARNSHSSAAITKDARPCQKVGLKRGRVQRAPALFGFTPSDDDWAFDKRDPYFGRYVRSVYLPGSMLVSL